MLIWSPAFNNSDQVSSLLNSSKAISTVMCDRFLTELDHVTC